MNILYQIGEVVWIITVGVIAIFLLALITWGIMLLCAAACDAWFNRDR